MINLSLEYRTRSGLLTRALSYTYRPQRVFLFGNLQETGLRERMIIGQIRVNSVWKNAEWKEDGTHEYNEDLNLVEYKAPEVKAPQLF